MIVVETMYIYPADMNLKFLSLHYYVTRNLIFWLKMWPYKRLVSDANDVLLDLTADHDNFVEITRLSAQYIRFKLILRRNLLAPLNIFIP